MREGTEQELKKECVALRGTAGCSAVPGCDPRPSLDDNCDAMIDTGEMPLRTMPGEDCQSEQEDRERERSERRASRLIPPTAPTPPTPSSPAATPRDPVDTPAIALNEGQRRTEIEATAMKARARVLQNPQQMITADKEGNRRATIARTQAESDGGGVPSDGKLLFTHSVTGALKELSSSPLVESYSSLIPQRHLAQGKINSRPSSSHSFGKSATLSEFVSYAVGDVTPVGSDAGSQIGDDDDVWHMRRQLSHLDEESSTRFLDSLAFGDWEGVQPSHGHGGPVAAPGFRPVVLLSLSDMHQVSVDLPPDLPGPRLTDTECSLVGLALSLPVENFQTWVDTPRWLRGDVAPCTLRISHPHVHYATHDDLWVNPYDTDPADPSFAGALVLDLSDLYVFDHLVEDGVLSTYPVATGASQQHRAVQLQRQNTAARTLGCAWRCHRARQHFEQAMDRLIQDPGELIRGWAHRLEGDTTATAPHPELPALDLTRAIHSKDKVSPGKSVRSSRRSVGTARSGFTSVRSARSGGMSPVLNLLVETRTLVQALPEEQGVALLSALLRGASPVALAAQARIDQAATRMMLDLPSRTLGRGGRTAAEEETAPLSPMSALHHLLSQGDEEAAVANAVEAAPAEEGVEVAGAGEEQTEGEAGQEAEAEEGETEEVRMWRETFDSEQQALDQKSLHVDFVMEMKMDEVGGEWSAEQLMEAHRAGKQLEALPRTADDKDGEGEARAEETEEENLERLKAEKRDKFMASFIREVAKGIDGDADKIRIISIQAGSVVVKVQVQQGACVGVSSINDIIESLQDLLDEAMEYGRKFFDMEPKAQRKAMKRPKWRYLLRGQSMRVAKLPAGVEARPRPSLEERHGQGEAQDDQQAEADTGSVQPSTLAEEAEGQNAEMEEEEDGDTVADTAGTGTGTRFWSRVTKVWPLQEWFQYDGCEVKVCNNAGDTTNGRLCVIEDTTELKIWKDSNQRIAQDAVVRAQEELAQPGELQLGPKCRIRKSQTRADGSSEMVSSNGQLLKRDGDVVGIKTTTRYSHKYMTLEDFLREARADELSLAALGEAPGGAECLMRCPCFEWEGACKRCKGNMASMGVHHPERKIRVNVVDLKRGVDAWVPLYLYAAHQLTPLQSFCESAGVVTATPMRVVMIRLGGGALPNGWRVDYSPEGYVYTNYILQISQATHPTVVERSLQDLGISEKRVRAASHQDFSKELAATRTRGRPSRVGPDGRWSAGISQRKPDAPGKTQAQAELGLHGQLVVAAEQGGVPAKKKRAKVARRVYKARRTLPPYSHAAYSSAMLIQSVFRGHAQRVLLLVTRRLQPTFVMPIRIASLAHTMIQMPTAFHMFKRMLLYYKRFGRGLRVPGVDSFRWPSEQELDRLHAMVLRLQCAYRRHLGAKRMMDRLYERAEKAQIANIIKTAQNEMTAKQQSTHDATLSMREGLMRAGGGKEAAQLVGGEDPRQSGWSPFLVLSEPENLWLESVTNAPLHQDNLVYCASRDGWDPAAFRDLVNGKHNLLVLASCSSPAHRPRSLSADDVLKGRTIEDVTHIFGAFTSLPYQRHGGFKTDPAAFLFSLRAAGRATDKPGLAPCPVVEMFKCDQVTEDFKARERGCAVMHYSTFTPHEGQFLNQGMVFGAGPDLYIDLENPTQCTSQLGRTYALPHECAVTDDGPAFLTGSSPFHALDVAVFQMIDTHGPAAAKKEQMKKEERHQVGLDRIHAIGDWLEDQDISGSSGFGGEVRKEQRPLHLSPALVITRPIMDVLTGWMNCPDLKHSKCLYLASRDGYSNDKFHEKMDGVGPATLMLVRTASQFLFGAYCTEPWQSKKRAVDVLTGEEVLTPDEIGTWVYDEQVRVADGACSLGGCICRRSVICATQLH